MALGETERRGWPEAVTRVSHGPAMEGRRGQLLPAPRGYARFRDHSSQVFRRCASRSELSAPPSQATSRDNPIPSNTLTGSPTRSGATPNRFPPLRFACPCVARAPPARRRATGWSAGVRPDSSPCLSSGCVLGLCPRCYATIGGKHREFGRGETRKEPRRLACPNPDALPVLGLTLTPCLSWG